ncbi:hypothetical protein ACIBG7_21180 [Nonomuraea sp. NPDC050328]|uniref:hypothetical protein n=1 Tax=Nonomuraea sp. NPDC050328 TaxID=3364361 RepID=UPI00379657EA
MSYVAKRDALWFLRKRAYTVFVARELTSVFVAWAIVFLILLLDAAVNGGDFRAFAAQPWVIGLNLLTLAATVFHTITFLNLAPKATVVRLDGWRVPAFLIQGGNHSLWVLVSAIVAFFVLRGA